MEHSTVFSAHHWNTWEGHTVLNPLRAPTETSVIGTTSSDLANAGHAFPCLSDLFHEKALSTMSPPLLLASVQRPSNIHLCHRPLTK